MKKPFEIGDRVSQECLSVEAGKIVKRYGKVVEVDGALIYVDLDEPKYASRLRVPASWCRRIVKKQRREWWLVTSERYANVAHETLELANHAASLSTDQVTVVHVMEVRRRREA